MVELFLRADFMIKIVILVLLFTFVWSWFILLRKKVQLSRLNRQANVFEHRFWSIGSLDLLYEQIRKHPGDPMAKTFVVGMHEWRYAATRHVITYTFLHQGFQQRVERVMRLTIGREVSILKRSMTSLASISSITPLIGLFGMVWSLMNSFFSIAQTNMINLTILAPHMVEAFFTLALGLVTAIPTLIGYRYFCYFLTTYVERLENFVTEFTILLSRHLEDQEKNSITE